MESIDGANSHGLYRGQVGQKRKGRQIGYYGTREDRLRVKGRSKVYLYQEVDNVSVTWRSVRGGRMGLSKGYGKYFSSISSAV